MKKIFYGITALAGLTLASCNDFLTEEPRTQFSQSQVYSSVAGAQAALNACYAYLSNYQLYGQKLQILLSGSAGTMTIGNTTSQYLVDLSSLDIQTNNSAVEDVYTGSYQTINAINDVIINLPGSSIEPGAKERILGEAYFLRALVYFNLVRIVGPAPYVVEPAKSFADLHRPRAPIGELYSFILSDLDQAWSLMPEPGDQPYGRPHRYAAKFLLAKVNVALACIKEHPDEPFDASWLDKPARDYWQAAYDHASEVDLNGGYDLVPDFARLWDCYNKYTVESIFELEENKETGSCSFMYHYLPGYYEGVPNTNSSNNYGRIRTQRESWDEHYDRYRSGNVHDYRLDVTYIDSLYKRNMTATSSPGVIYYTYPYTRFNLPAGVSTNSRSEELPYIKKYVDPRFTATDANVNVIVLRFADVLLTLAEAANELDNTPEAVGYVNRLLARARNTPQGQRAQPANWPLNISKEEFRTNIMIERRLELKAEQHEWFDNRRRGAAELKKIMQTHNDLLNSFPFKSGSTTERDIMTYDYYYDLSDRNVKKNLLCPFPLAEISANNNISEQDQNFGY